MVRRCLGHNMLSRGECGGASPPDFSKNKTNNSSARPASFAWPHSPALAGAEPESGPPSKSRRFEWELCEPREGGRGSGENESMWRAAGRVPDVGSKAEKVVLYRLAPHPTPLPRFAGARESHRAGGG